MIAYQRRVLALLCLLQVVACAGLAASHNPVMDEVAHLPAGVRHWRNGKFDLYRVDPPLVRLVAALPAVILGCHEDWVRVSPDPRARSEFDVGIDFIVANREGSWLLFNLGRLALIPFGIVGLLACYGLAQRLYGRSAGLLAAALWAICPNVLAYQSLILPDAPAGALAVLAAYCFWGWLTAPTWRGALLSGAALGTAWLTKTTLLIFGPLWLVLAALATIPLLTTRQWRATLRQAGQFSAILLTALYVLHAGYGFERSGVPLGDFQFASRLLGGGTREATLLNLTGNRFSETPLAAVPSPVPASFLEGIDLQEREYDEGYRVYLRGRWHDQGVLWFYLYALLVKLPLGHLALIGAGLALAARDFRRPETAGTWFVLLHAVAILVLVSSHTSCCRYVRYVLPALPFLFVAASGVLAGARANSGRWLAFTVVCLTASASSVAWQYPHLMSYFNEAAGGPANGHYHLIDANIDWGQDLLFLRRWQSEHPEAKPFYLAYSGTLNPAWLGIEFEAPPQLRPTGNPAAVEGDAAGEPLTQGLFVSKATPEANANSDAPLPAGWYAISVNLLRGEQTFVPDGTGRTIPVTKPVFAPFLDGEPVGYAGRSIYIYRID